MRKKVITLLCAGFMVFSLTGCGDDDTGKGKDKTAIPISTSIQPTDTEEPEEPPIEEIKPNTDYDWVTAGSDRTGYAKVPGNYQKHESTEKGQYSLQYVSTQDGGLITFLDSNYGLDSDTLAQEADPANIIIQAYESQYEQMNGSNIEKTAVIMDGVSFYRSIDSVPAGSIQSYEYWLYTYVAYTNDRFYTVIAEGKEDTARELSEKIEDTFHFDEGNTDSNGSSSGGSSTIGESGEANWTNYEIILDGDKYTLPCSVSELEANGWSFSDFVYDADDVLEPDGYNYIFMERNGVEAYVIIGNPSENSSTTFRAGQLIGLIIDYSLADTDSSAAGGVTLGMNLNQVISILGEPAYSYNDANEIMLTYESPDYMQDMFSTLDIFLTDDVVTEIEIGHK